MQSATDPAGPEAGGPEVATSFVVPCYQEEEALDGLGTRLPAFPADEIVFVDDGSTDGTAAALAGLARRDTRVRLVAHDRNLGVGAAMRTGIAATRGARVVVYDADASYPLEDARVLLDALEGGIDVATASPFGRGGRLAGVPRGRALLSRAAATAYRLVLGRRARGLSVLTCAFRAWDGPLVRSLAWRSDGFPAAAEMLGRALLAGARVVEVPSTLVVRTLGRSKMRVLPAAWGHLGVLLRLLGARLGGGRRPRARAQ